MSGFDYFQMALVDNYANFEGRARRSEYWYFTLFSMMLFILLMIVMYMIPTIGTILIVLAGLGLIIPSIAVTVRRLHDIGKSGWWYLLAFVPLGGIVLFVFSVMDSQPGSNEYGPNPKEFNDDIVDNLV